MPRLAAFNNVSLDGFFTDAKGDMNWAHKGSDDPEFTAFVAGNATGGGALLLGRVTHDMMAAFWPTPMAEQMMPVVAKGMNSMPKYVLSRSVRQSAWKNCTFLAGEIVEAMRTLKAATGPDIAILGSGSIVSQLTAAGLIDEYQVVVNPIVLGGGRTMFGIVAAPVSLTLTESRAFPNGKVFLRYTAGA
jgi:dihydrofolate reductase